MPFHTATGQAVTHSAEVLAVHALALEDTLQTAILISLFTDRRAGADDTLPLNVQQRRGWVGDEFVSPGDAWGSLLWLAHSGKQLDQVAEQARFWAAESLAWMVRDGVASRVDVTVAWVVTTSGTAERLALRPQMYQPDTASPVYDVVWGTTIARGLQA